MKFIRPGLVLSAIATVCATSYAMQPALIESSAAMRTAFEQAPNYSAFIQDALRRPGEGGKFYASFAFNRCQELAALEPKHFIEGEQSPRRDKAITQIKTLMERCTGVTNNWADAPLIARGGLIPADKTEVLNDVIRAVATGDAYMIAVTVEINSDYLAELSIPWYVPDRHRRIGNLAAGAAACEIAKECLDHLWIQLMCATGQDCRYSDLRAFLRDGLSAVETRQFDAIKLALLKHAGRQAGS